MKSIKSTVILFLTAIIWGFAFVAQNAAGDLIGAFTYNGVRFVLGALSLIPVILIFEKKENQGHSKKLKTTLLSGVLAGIVLCIASWLQQLGIEITHSPGKGGFITGLYMILVPLFGIFLKKKTSIAVWIGAAISVVGLFLLCVDERMMLGYGEGILLLGSVFWALHILIIDKFVNEIYSLRFASIQFLTCAIISIVCALLFEDISFNNIQAAALPILYGGIMSVGVAYTCQIIGQKDADPAIASIILSTESMFAAIGGAIFGDTLNVNGYIGCVLMFIGIMLTQITPKPRKY